MLVQAKIERVKFIVRSYICTRLLKRNTPMVEKDHTSCLDFEIDTLSDKIALLSCESLDNMHSQGVVIPITPCTQSQLSNRFCHMERKKLLRLYKALIRGGITLSAYDLIPPSAMMTRSLEENEWPSTSLVPLFVLLGYTIATTQTTF
ncbi:uncharacterized protein LACBIDRAFT_329256 [Laccaria bicolor S238N-H82]|uniref:Predicted protein n=1 Tax=Laccaria bicolor (strain S238N-H82 / ATCC MYA-4686) TaxID=486041 RepID=B0DHI4_LACBS|nr:uncharacterized protein LACBIDRAFT_329256 [Laccaria bicolor S238N-H82]EDR06110.1 predicted protein [Laccaria bicolor S238N-H82]|eukprot:XP_001883398.1 predicted protein [Laccaria bicolor S238N-H82]